MTGNGNLKSTSIKYHRCLLSDFNLIQWVRYLRKTFQFLQDKHIRLPYDLGLVKSNNFSWPYLWGTIVSQTNKEHLNVHHDAWKHEHTFHITGPLISHSPWQCQTHVSFSVWNITKVVICLGTVFTISFIYHSIIVMSLISYTYTWLAAVSHMNYSKEICWSIHPRRRTIYVVCFVMPTHGSFCVWA